MNLIRTLVLVLLGLVITGCWTREAATETRDRSAPIQPRPSETASPDVPGTITVEAAGLTAEEKRMFADAFKDLLTKAIGEVIQEGIDRAIRELELSDEAELKLLGALPKVGEGAAIDDIMSVYLIRPGKTVAQPRQVIFQKDGKPWLRFTRTTGPVERHIAIVSSSAVVDGKLTIVEWIMVYDPDGDWKKKQPTTKTVN
jgi:hypothetical protein